MFSFTSQKKRNGGGLNVSVMKNHRGRKPSSVTNSICCAIILWRDLFIKNNLQEKEYTNYWPYDNSIGILGCFVIATYLLIIKQNHEELTQTAPKRSKWCGGFEVIHCQFIWTALSMPIICKSPDLLCRPGGIRTVSAL